jgi:hypothetical protein
LCLKSFLSSLKVSYMVPTSKIPKFLFIDFSFLYY